VFHIDDALNLKCHNNYRSYIVSSEYVKAIINTDLKGGGKKIVNLF
jgi:hypothetical protein